MEKRFHFTNDKIRSLPPDARDTDLDVSTPRRIARKHLAQIPEGLDPLEVREKIKALPTISEFFRQTHLP